MSPEIDSGFLHRFAAKKTPDDDFVTRPRCMAMAEKTRRFLEAHVALGAVDEIWTGLASRWRRLRWKEVLGCGEETCECETTVSMDIFQCLSQRNDLFVLT
jgi:hypothetical protein